METRKPAGVGNCNRCGAREVPRWIWEQTFHVRDWFGDERATKEISLAEKLCSDCLKEQLDKGQRKV